MAQPIIEVKNVSMMFNISSENKASIKLTLITYLPLWLIHSLCCFECEE